MPPLRHVKNINSQTMPSKRNRSKNVLSQKRLQGMIERAQGTDSHLATPKSNFDNSDLRTEAEKGALLLWVCHQNDNIKPY